MGSSLDEGPFFGPRYKPYKKDPKRDPNLENYPPVCSRLLALRDWALGARAQGVQGLNVIGTPD